MCDGRKLIGMHGNNKILFEMLHFLRKYRITLTVMQLGSLQPVYDTY
jgi:hypothetical protein